LLFFSFIENENINQLPQGEEYDVDDGAEQSKAKMKKNTPTEWHHIIRKPYIKNLLFLSSCFYFAIDVRVSPLEICWHSKMWTGLPQWAMDKCILYDLDERSV
jgi:hypothetical protein